MLKMTSKIVLDIPLPPVPASRPRVTRYGTFYGKRYNDFKNDLGLWLDVCWGRNKKLDGQISIVWCKFKVKMPISWSQKKKQAMQGKPHISKPDADNLLKALKDGLSGRLYEDDCQVWRIENITKTWDMEGGIELELSSEV